MSRLSSATVSSPSLPRDPADDAGDEVVELHQDRAVGLTLPADDQGKDRLHHPERPEPHRGAAL